MGKFPSGSQCYAMVEKCFAWPRVDLAKACSVVVCVFADSADSESIIISSYNSLPSTCITYTHVYHTTHSDSSMHFPSLLLRLWARET